jgi:ElaB/YqjD/DUF883 family membrane-anchored ribosome-binding protein
MVPLDNTQEAARSPEELQEQILQARGLKDRAKAAGYQAKGAICRHPAQSIALGMVVGLVIGVLSLYYHRKT